MGIIQAHRVEKSKARDQSRLRGDHHGAQQHDEYDILSLKIDAGKGIGRKRRNKKLAHDGGSGKDKRVLDHIQERNGLAR